MHNVIDGDVIQRDDIYIGRSNEEVMIMAEDDDPNEVLLREEFGFTPSRLVAQTEEQTGKSRDRNEQVAKYIQSLPGN